MEGNVWGGDDKRCEPGVRAAHREAEQVRQPRAIAHRHVARPLLDGHKRGRCGGVHPRRGSVRVGGEGRATYIGLFGFRYLWRLLVLVAPLFASLASARLSA